MLLDLIVKTMAKEQVGNTLFLSRWFQNFGLQSNVRNALNILIELRIIEASDVIEYYLLKVPSHLGYGTADFGRGNNE